MKITNVFDDKLVRIGDKFLQNNKSLISLDMRSVNSIGSCFLSHNNSLVSLNLFDTAVVEDSTFWQTSTARKRCSTDFTLNRRGSNERTK